MQAKKDKQEMMLSGMQIIDLTDEKASFCSKLLADLGATVIKIEKPGGDSSRDIGPFIGDVQHPEKSLSFFYNNTGKLGITLDITHEEGKKIFLKLIAKADIIVESYPPDYLESLNLGFDEFCKINPMVIRASVTGFGQKGPKKNHKSCELVAAATGGQMYASGSPDTPPLKAAQAQPCFSASLFAAVGILFAYRKRSQTGHGEHIHISLQEAVTSTLEHVLVRYFYENVIPKRQGNENRFNDFCIMPCKDGFIQMTLFQQWDTLVEWMASKGMAENLIHEKWMDPEYRADNRNHIIRIIKKWTRAHTVNELIDLGQLMRFPWAPVCSPEAVLKSPQLKDRQFFKKVHHSETDNMIACPGSPFKLNPTIDMPIGPAPKIGEHNEKIFKEELKLSDGKIEKLSSQNVI